MTDYRLKLIIRIVPLLTVLILIRLAYWQIIRGKELSLRADKQHQSKEFLPARRGEILDFKGNVLAQDKTLYHLFYYRPDSTLADDELIDKLLPILSTPSASIKSVLQERLSSKSNWISLKHYLTRDQKILIDQLGLSGVGFQDELVRYYPEATSAAHILGFVGKDALGQPKGYFGIEGYFDRQLQGRDGLLKMQTDAFGRPILIGKLNQIKYQNGRTIGTTIDRRLQLIVSQQLAGGLERYQASAASAIVVETKTGKIRAMADLPSYDSNSYFQYDPKIYANPNTSGLFEPGSTFKVIIMAAALDLGLVKRDSICDSCSGPISIGKYLIRTWNEQYHPNSTMEDVIINSDNIGMVFVAKKIGATNMINYLTRFGFGEKTSIDQQEEVAKQLKKPEDLKEIDLATNSFGQGIAVTPIQLVMAVNSIANAGQWVSPILVDRYYEDDQEIIMPDKPNRKVISSQTAQTMTDIMVQAVKKGESKWAAPKNFNVAGKTGTAQIPIQGHYDEEKTIASFVGFFPAEKPEYTMLVTVREPKTSPWGSETAAPLWFSIAKSILE